MPLDKLVIRQKIISLCRQFFTDNSFQEFTLPILYKSIPKEPNIYPFTTTSSNSIDKNETLFLAPSPETGLKKIISQHPANCFAISPSFRNLENIGPHHSLEFLMLEWYEIDKNYQDIMVTTENLIRFIDRSLGTNLISPKPFSIFPLPVSLPDNEPDFNQYFLNTIEPSLSPDPTFITGYPAYLSPLAKKINDEANNFSENKIDAGNVFFRAQSSEVHTEGREHEKKSLPNQSSERFELYLNKIEIANGCTENLTPEISVPWENLPFSAGCGLGIDRLVMFFTQADKIRAII